MVGEVSSSSVRTFMVSDVAGRAGIGRSMPGRAVLVIDGGAEQVRRRRRRSYFIDTLVAAFSMSSATALGCET
jgi:hypothetical protein